MRILDRYLQTEIITTWVGITSLLLLVTVGLYLGDTLADVARGTVPGQLLFVTLSLRSLEALTVLLPLSLFLGIMLAFGRLYRDSEMTVIGTLGFGRASLFRPLAGLLIPVFLLLLVLAGWVSPWAQRTSKTMIAEATRNVSVAGLKAGQFHQIAANDSVVYVELVESDGVSFRNAFIHTEREGRKDVVTAQRGFQYTDEESGARFLALFDGFRSEGIPGQADYRLMRFERNDVRLPELEGAGPNLRRSALKLEELLLEAQPADWAELHWRLAPPMAALVLSLLAVPLSRTTPRQGYYGNLIIAILAYVIYANLLAAGRSWLESGDLPPPVGLWWVHALVLAITALLMRDRLAGRRRQARRAAEAGA